MGCNYGDLTLEPPFFLFLFEMKKGVHLKTTNSLRRFLNTFRSTQNANVFFNFRLLSGYRAASNWLNKPKKIRSFFSPVPLQKDPRKSSYLGTADTSCWLPVPSCSVWMKNGRGFSCQLDIVALAVNHQCKIWQCQNSSNLIIFVFLS